MHKRTVLGWLFAAVALACAAAPAQTFAGTAEVVEVEIAVQVTRDGQIVRGLTAADFELYDGRKKLLLFDLAFSDPRAIVKAREAARELVLEGSRAGDLVGVATYSAARGPQLVLGFTSDRRQVDAALDSLGLVSAEGEYLLRVSLSGAAGAAGASSAPFVVSARR